MSSRVVVLLAGALALAACKKSENAPAQAAGSAAGSGSAEAKPDPWAAPPPPTKTAATVKGAAQLGDDLAKIDPKADDGGGGGRLSKMAKKIELSQVAKPVETGPQLKGFGKIESTGFSVTYNPSPDATHEQYRSVLRDNHVFENVVEGLNKTIRMPRTVDVQLVDCNTINAFYDPGNSRIIVCYELLDYFLSVFKGNVKSDEDLGNAVIGATMFSFYHETGHGLIHQLDLPAVGREEDSVDQLATLILMAGGDSGVSMALSGAYWFQLQSKQANHETPFWDEHAFDGQRFYNILCLIYGSDPQKYGEFVTSGNLPKDRAQRCPEEYAKINKAWEKLLEPHLTNGAAENIDYKPSVPTAEAPTTTATDPLGDDSTPPATPQGPTIPLPSTGVAVPEAPQPQPEPAAQPKPAPASGGITCEQVATKAAELIGEEAATQAKNMTAEQVEELKAKLEAELPAALQSILAECAKANWSQASRKCVMNAKTLAQAGACN